MGSKRKVLVQINTVCNNSTGRIMHDIQQKAYESGYETYSFVGRRKVYTDLPCVKYGNGISFWIHVFINTVFDRQGYGSYFQTKKLVNRLRNIKPDVIHLHNLHGYYLNIPLLFHYLSSEYKGKVYWTFHDLWPITGHCAYYSNAGCNKWKTQCNHCPNKKAYPISWGLDLSKKNYLAKKMMFSGINNLHIIVPSKWMFEQVKQSFLNEKKVSVVSNGIDLDVFSIPKSEIENRVEILNKYGIQTNKKIVLGIASVWEPRKGLAQFYDLSQVLSKEYQIVLIGLSKRQMRSCPSNIIAISRTDNQSDLAKIYAASDVMVNFSKEESFSLITIESMACGTPVIGYGETAIAELINCNNGEIINSDDMDKIVESIYRVCDRDWDPEMVRETVMGYTKEKMGKNVLELYRGEKECL